MLTLEREDHLALQGPYGFTCTASFSVSATSSSCWEIVRYLYSKDRRKTRLLDVTLLVPAGDRFDNEGDYR